MIATENAQSVDEFARTAAQTLERLDKTGGPEVLTVDGEPRAVLLSPAAYAEFEKEILLSRDVEAIRLSMKQIDEGKTMEAREFFVGVRAELSAMKAAQERLAAG